jgi:hypothetical protein
MGLAGWVQKRPFLISAHKSCLHIASTPQNEVGGWVVGSEKAQKRAYVIYEWSPR